MMRQLHLWIACAVSFLALGRSLADPATVCRAGEVDGAWESDFRAPPGAARPWVYWCWMNGNMTREGITADLEAMKRVGIGGVLLMELDDGMPVGPVAFAGSKWRELFKHTCAEAHRLGLEVNMNNDAGWEGSGGPWITPELAMQKVVWKETAAEGPKHLEAVLPAPKRWKTIIATSGCWRFPRRPAAPGSEIWLSRANSITRTCFPPPPSGPRRRRRKRFRAIASWI